MADQTSVYADRASFGVTDTAVPSGPLRLVGLGAAAVASSRLAIDASGNVTAGVLAAGDIPSVFTRRDVAETIDESWTWAAGKTIAFTPGTMAAPAATSRSLGTRLVIEPVASSTEYAFGREAGALWVSMPIGGAQKWYQGATERLRLDGNGTLHVLNGTGGILLAAAGTGDGALVATTSLQLRAYGGGMTLQTSEGRIVPTLGYRENLGEINRKYLSLHAAELWVESLVAQDTIATIGGRVLVCPTTMLTRDCAPADASVYVKHNAFSLYVGGVEYGSKLVLQSGGKFEVMRLLNASVPVAESAGDYRYDVERNVDGSGANQWYAGDAVVDTGKYTTGPGGFIDLYSVNGLRAGTTAGPTIVGNVRYGGGATDWREHWAIGNLQGVYGNSTRKMGAAFGDAAGMHLQVDATDGIRFLTGAGAVYGQWAMNGDLAVGFPAAGQLLFTAVDGVLRFKFAGQDKMILNSDGTLRLATQLIVGGLATGTQTVRSYYAGAWNSGHGFFFGYNTDTTVTTALIGDSLTRRVQWDGASLKVISDGFTLDENGITLGQNTGGGVTSGRVLQFGTGVGGYLWDTSYGAEPRFEILRGTQEIRIVAQSTTNGKVTLQAGGSSTDRVILRINSGGVGVASSVILDWNSTGGITYLLAPRITPQFSDVAWLGTNSARWRVVHSWIGAFGNVASPGSYHVELGGDAAGKPVSSTWTIISDISTKHAIEPVDARAALDVVRQVPIVRYRTNDGDLPAIGVVAQDVAQLLPLSVHARSTDGLLDFNAHELLMLNVAAVQALASRLDALERKPE